MPAPTAAELLDLWERGRAAAAPERALLLLAAADPALEAPARLPLGQRDARLLRLRAAVFGERLECTARCPACAEPLEFDLRVADLLRPAGMDDASVAPDAPLSVEHDAWAVTARLPGTDDVAQAAGAADAVGALLERCILTAARDGEPVDPRALPAPVVEAVAARMAEADPQADTQLATTCPACAHAWSAGLDVPAFLWQELDAWAPRLLRDVHVLARAYGWRQADILALSAFRRQCFLDQVLA